MKNTLSILTILSTLVCISCHKRGIANDSTSSNQEVVKDSIPKEGYWSSDSMLLKEYVTDNGNTIQLRGYYPRLESTYKISTVSQKGFKKSFDITDNEYIANRTSVLWDNEDFVFVRYGCGVPCWGAKVLSLNDNTETEDYLTYLYDDSLNNLIVYPSEDWEYLILEDFSTKQKTSEKFDSLDYELYPYDAIKNITFKSTKSVEVEYSSKSSAILKKKTIKIKN